MLTTLWITAALAGNADISVKIEGSQTRHVFVDGKLRGAAKGGKAVKVRLSTGKHEVAVAHDKDAHWLVCVGEVDLRRDTTVEAQQARCTNVTKAEPRTEKTVRVGGIVTFTGAGANGTVSIAGHSRAVKPGMAMLANVATGTHEVKGPNCTGKVTVKKGATAAIVLADGKCVGLDDAGGKKKKKKK